MTEANTHTALNNEDRSSLVMTGHLEIKWLTIIITLKKTKQFFFKYKKCGLRCLIMWWLIYYEMTEGIYSRFCIIFLVVIA